MPVERQPLKVNDSRKKRDADQQLALAERLKFDNVAIALTKIKALLGDYSPIEPSSLEVTITDGNLGEGTIKGTTIEVQIPPTDEANEQLWAQMGALLENIPEENRPNKYKEILMALSASTILHEGTHGLLDSKPNSKLAIDFERISGLENIKGKVSTLLDEGITYAIQTEFAPKIEPVGNLAPLAKGTDAIEVSQRKILGEKLTSKVKEYIEQGKAIDEEFLSFASDRIKEVLSVNDRS